MTKNSIITSLLSKVLKPSSVRQEKQFARKMSHDLLTCLQIEKMFNPRMDKRSLYARATVRQLNVEPQEAQKIVRQAEESFAKWPNNRDVTFVDVVRYVVIKKFMETHNDRDGLGPHFTEIVQTMIPSTI